MVRKTSKRFEDNCKKYFELGIHDAMNNAVKAKNLTQLNRNMVMFYYFLPDSVKLANNALKSYDKNFKLNLYKKLIFSRLSWIIFIANSVFCLFITVLRII